jgi:2-polyprenyl-6-methoxyphenol hydroxylase-like FAD-dependent oxidoreductase
MDGRSMQTKTVLISGAGIGGPTLAYWLQQAGFAPTIVEHAPALRTGGYVIDFWGLGYDIAERMGLLEDINRLGYHARELRIVGNAGERIAGFGTRIFEELTDGRYVTIARSGLSRLLFEAADSGTETIFGDEIVALEQTAADVDVRFRDGAERRFDLVIGADGLHSRVRDLVFGPEQQFEKHLGYAVAAFEAEAYRPRDEDVYVMYSKPGRMIGRFTLHDDRALFLFVLANDGRPLPQTLEDQKALLQKTHKNDQWELRFILRELDRTKDLYFDSVSQIRMPAWSKGRIALIGDAAFCVSLLAGQGSALAMISAFVMAGELAKAEGNYERAFANYESRLRAYIEMKQKGAEMFAGAFAPRTTWGLWFRNQVIRAFAIPGVARLAVGREISDRLPLPDYHWQAG